MLCRQVERAVHLFFAGECADDALSQLCVIGVQPAPNAGHLLIQVVVPASIGMPLPDLLSRLTQITPRIRHSLAATISRKRVPNLSFLPVASMPNLGDAHDY
jgi:hypothetical protein